MKGKFPKECIIGLTQWAWLGRGSMGRVSEVGGVLTQTEIICMDSHLSLLSHSLYSQLFLIVCFLTITGGTYLYQIIALIQLYVQ